MQVFNKVSSTIQFNYDPILYTTNIQYAGDFKKKIVYFLIQIVQKNPNITVNQTCSLLRNTLQIPDALTRSCLDILTNCLAIKTFKETDAIVHLICNDTSICRELILLYPELIEYQAPIYNKGNLKGGSVARQMEVN